MRNKKEKTPNNVLKSPLRVDYRTKGLLIRINNLCYFILY